MLFIRNHEREVELDEIKDAYEHEISLVIQVSHVKPPLFVRSNALIQDEIQGAIVTINTDSLYTDSPTSTCLLFM